MVLLPCCCLSENDPLALVPSREQEGGASTVEQQEAVANWSVSRFGKFLSDPWQKHKLAVVPVLWGVDPNLVSREKTVGWR